MNDRTNQTGNSHVLVYEGVGERWAMRGGGCEHATHGRLITQTSRSEDDATMHDHDEVASMFVTYHCAYFSWGGGGGGDIILISGDKLCRTCAEMIVITYNVWSQIKGNCHELHWL